MGNGLWSNPPAQVLAWTFVHSIWQGLVIAFLFMLCRAVVKEPSKRYNVGLLCFAIFIGLQICTVFYCQRWTKGEGVSLPLTLSTDAAAEVRIPYQLSASGQRTPILPPEPSVLLTAAETASPVVFWITIAWIAGTWCCLLRYGIASYLLKKELDLCVPIASEQSNGYERLAKRLRLDVSVKYLTTTQSSVPATCGWWSPRVLLPTQKRLKLAGKFLDAIVLHELAHIVRRDSLTHLVRSVIHSIYFFHPLVRWMDREMTNDSEKAADEIAADALGDSKVYAHALLTLEETRANALMLGASGGSLKDRLLHIIASREARRRNASNLSVFMMVLCGMLAIMTCSEVIVRSASPEQKLLAWVSNRNLPEAVLPSLAINTDEDHASVALERAVAEQTENQSISAETLKQLSAAIHAGTPADLITREYAKLPYGRSVGRAVELPRFGSAHARRDIARQLTLHAEQCGDRSTQAHYARAAYALLALDIVAVNGNDAQLWFLNSTQARMLHLDPQAECTVDFAVGMFNARGLKSGNMLEGISNLAPAEVDACLDAAAYLPSMQSMFASIATSQDWERLRVALTNAREDVKGRWVKTYPQLAER